MWKLFELFLLAIQDIVTFIEKNHISQCVTPNLLGDASINKDVAI